MTRPVEIECVQQKCECKHTELNTAAVLLYSHTEHGWDWRDTPATRVDKQAIPYFTELSHGNVKFHIDAML